MLRKYSENLITEKLQNLEIFFVNFLEKILTGENTKKNVIDHKRKIEKKKILLKIFINNRKQNTVF